MATLGAGATVLLAMEAWTVGMVVKVLKVLGVMALEKRLPSTRWTISH